MDVLSFLRPRGAVTAASPEALTRLRALKCPEPLVELYATCDGGFAEGVVFWPASRVTRQGDLVDTTAVRGMLVFGTNGKAYQHEQVFAVDVPGFFGTPGAIVRGTVKLKWGWANHVSDDAAQFLSSLGKKAPRGQGIAKQARKALEKAVAAARKRGGITLTDGDPSVDPDRASRNLKNDGRTEIPWAITHLYAVLGELERDGRRVRPFLAVDHTPDDFPDLARGYVFAEDADAQWVVSQGRTSFPEGLVLRVPRAQPSALTVHGHLLAVVTAWLEGREAPGEPVAEWIIRIG